METLCKVGVPKYVVSVLVNWYSKLSAVVRNWNNALSKLITVKSGVRQGSILSPSLFNVLSMQLL